MRISVVGIFEVDLNIGINVWTVGDVIIISVEGVGILMVDV